MDDLALLAQTHGSGSETVRDLRENGIRTAKDVAELEPAELGRLAGLKPAAARKMVAAARRMVGMDSSGTRGGAASSEDETPAAPGLSAVVARGRPRRTLAEAEARAATAASDPPGERESEGALAADLEEGVNTEEVSALLVGRGSAAADPRKEDRANWLPSFWRFG